RRGLTGLIRLPFVIRRGERPLAGKDFHRPHDPLASSPSRTPAAPTGAGTVRQSDQDREQAQRLSSVPPNSEMDLGVIEPPTELASPSEVRRGVLRSGEVPQVPGYVVEEPLGEGTYGQVWRAREIDTGILVAIKFFPYGSPDQLQQLQSEVSQLAQLDSVQGIVALKEANLNAERPYYVMSYAERGSLAERLEKQKQLPLAEALSIFRQVAEALAYVHAKGIRHCDLKPGNILLD